MVNVRVFWDLSLISFNIAPHDRSSTLILEDNLVKSRRLLVYLLSLKFIHSCGDWRFHVTKEGIDISECSVNLLCVFFLIIDSKPFFNGGDHIRLQSLRNANLRKFLVP